ncbi:MAG: hypothetical protein HRT51_09410 [Colwellia sp.]|nr:hypothetical protein [Colwellia sp.]
MEHGEFFDIQQIEVSEGFMYLYHVTTDKKINDIIKDKKLKGFNWSKGWRDIKVKIKYPHRLFINIDENLLNGPDANLVSIFRVCAWRYERVAIDEAGQYNNVAGPTKYNVLRFTDENIELEGFNHSIDDLAKKNGIEDPASLYWLVERNDDELSNSGIPFDKIQILSGDQWISLANV